MTVGIMAFVIRRGGIFHIEWKNPETNQRERFSTGLRTDKPVDVREIAALKAEYSAKEKRAAVHGPRQRAAADQWVNWIDTWLVARYGNKPLTLQTIRGCWRSINFFLKEHGIDRPRRLNREHCMGYIAWRTDPERPKKTVGLYKCGHNTARHEIVHLGTAMKEAVIRGYASANPCRDLGIGRVTPVQPIELTDSMLEELETAILREPEPAQVILWRSYLVARCHGVRLMEARVNPTEDVNLDLNEGTITFRQKGGKVREKPLHPRLFSLMAELKCAGATELFPCPARFSIFWFNFLRRSGLKAKYPKACFHSLRVTVQNKLRRATHIPREIRMEYLSHENRSVHDSYSRMNVNEMRVCHSVL